MASRKIREHWHATGWRIVGRTGPIQYDLMLPIEPEARVARKEPGMPWMYRIGGYEEKYRGRFRTAKAAMLAAEVQVRLALRKSLRMLG